MTTNKAFWKQQCRDKVAYTLNQGENLIIRVALFQFQQKFGILTLGGKTGNWNGVIVIIEFWKSKDFDNRVNTEVSRLSLSWRHCESLKSAYGVNPSPTIALGPLGLRV